mmetsp:Transcript_14871/g.32403  ORF Transcript_14871/g.32403 Transcript_14871/m.32403 type:complete len:217 (-) Transcript_14871:11521-12171(-)
MTASSPWYPSYSTTFLNISTSTSEDPQNAFWSSRAENRGNISVGMTLPKPSRKKLSILFCHQSNGLDGSPREASTSISYICEEGELISSAKVPQKVELGSGKSTKIPCRYAVPANRPRNKSASSTSRDASLRELSKLEKSFRMYNSFESIPSDGKPGRTSPRFWPLEEKINCPWFSPIPAAAFGDKSSTPKTPFPSLLVFRTSFIASAKTSLYGPE